MWQDILKTAIIGTERNALALPTGNDALSVLLSQLDPNNREAYLLQAAATVALYNLAGQMPDCTTQPLPSVAEADEIPACNTRATQHLSLLLGGEYKEVLPEWLAALAAAGKRVPEETLAKLLDLGQKNVPLRNAIVKVIGKRGLWLAQQHPDWCYAIYEVEESDWETSPRETRLALLKKLRATAPTRARALVAATWQQETPEDRAAFLSTFQTGLSLEDEPFLTAALDDRRKEVRKAAADLLARLPESALVKRMIERVQPLLTLKRKMLGKDKLEVLLPAACDKTMQRDGIEAKPPHSGIGEKAWWLQQMLGAIPPSFWNQLFEATAEDLMQILPKDWRDEFLTGWAQAAIRFGDTRWIEALLDYAHENNTVLDQAALVEALPSLRQEAYLIKLLRQAPKLSASSLVFHLLTNTDHTWSQDLSRTAFQVSVKQITGSTSQQDYWAGYYLQQIAIHLHPSVLAECLAALAKLRSASEQSEGYNIEAALNLLEFRLEMLKEITQ
jgi:hypothetical protein